MTFLTIKKNQRTSSSVSEEAPASLTDIVIGAALGQVAVTLAYALPSFLNRLLGF
jgi:hypothetical protein